ncbi:MAG TPA: DMT family transporter, partial [Kiloniellales bacterium]|nr:DMT family transporter [Kiloniellales bacterium]
VLVIVALLARSGWAQARPRRLGQHLLRNLGHFGGQYGWFYAVGFLPLATVFAIEFTMPFWVVLIAGLVLGERITGTRVLSVLLGFLGVLVLLRPGFEAIHPAAFAILAGAFGFAVSVTATKALTRDTTPLAILFYMTLMQLPMGLIPALPVWVWPGLETLPWLLLVGLAALSAHFCLTSALRLADATVVVPMDFLRLPLIALVGFLLYSEGIDLFVVLGAVLICAGNWINVRRAGR